MITYPYTFAIAEAKALAESIGCYILETVCQKNITRSKFGIGKGKAEELKDLTDRLKPDVIIFDEVLKPSQHYNLTKLCKTEIIDREKLILDIFLNSAVTNESKIQVKLAQLKYDIVRVKEKSRLAKMGEQPGFYGLGKYDADVHILDIKRRTRVLKKKLHDEEKKRTLHRVQRLTEKIPLISLTGYTSAGKTSLFNLLAHEKKETSEKLFTTLTTYTRSTTINNYKIFLSDTIGFISKLPPYMIEAFKSTLSELNFADVILLVIDFSDDIMSIRRKLKSSLDIMSRLEIPQNKCILVLNKVDLVTNFDLKDKLKKLNLDTMQHIVPISSRNGYNLKNLERKIEQMLEFNLQYEVN